MVSRKGPVEWVIRIASFVTFILAMIACLFMGTGVPSAGEVEDWIYEILESSPSEKEERENRPRNVFLMIFIYLILCFVVYYGTHNPFSVVDLGLAMAAVVFFSYYILHIPLSKIVGGLGILMILGAIAAVIVILFILSLGFWD